MKSTLELTYIELPNVEKNEDNDAILEHEIDSSRALLQSYLKKSDSELNEDSAYSNLERSLVAILTSYNVIDRDLTFSQNGNAEAEGKIEKVKVGSIEVEFAEKKSQNDFSLSGQEALEAKKKRFCLFATTLKIVHPLCFKAKIGSINTGFILVE